MLARGFRHGDDDVDVQGRNDGRRSATAQRGRSVAGMTFFVVGRLRRRRELSGDGLLGARACAGKRRADEAPEERRRARRAAT